MNQWKIGHVRFGLETEKQPIELSAMRIESSMLNGMDQKTQCYELTEIPGGRVLPERNPGETKPGDLSGQLFLTERDSVCTIRVQAAIRQNTMRECVTFETAVPAELELISEEKELTYSCQYQFNDWWTRPEFGTELSGLPARTESVFLKYGGTDGKPVTYGCLIPMLGKKTKAYLIGSGKSAEAQSIRLQLTAYASGVDSLDEIALVYAEGTDLFDAIHTAWQEACRISNVPMRKDRTFPSMFENFGWCSWDAFYTDVTEQKIRQKAEEFQQKGLPVRWFLIDDGWLSVKDSMLYSYKPEQTKFPDGFLKLTTDLKEHTSIRQVGVWHAFGGYWGGVLRGSEAEAFWRENLYYNRNGKVLPYPDAEKGYGFWRKWYEYLSSQGIDFVKVDGQSAVKNYFRNQECVGIAARQAHKALEAAVDLYMNGNLINCMGMAIENVLGRPASGLSRNSDDFLPEKEMGFAEHLMQNAYNALYHSQVYYGDWDMFWSRQEESGKHALLRAISGGPVYVSDRIGETDPSSIWPLIYSDGRILRMDRSALPTLHSVFNSPEQGNNMELTNVCGRHGAIALFHLGYSEQDQISEVCAADIPELKERRYLLYNRQTKQLKLVERTEKLTVVLKKNEYCCLLFTAIPDTESSPVIPIGLMDKYMSFHAVTAAAISPDKKEIRISLADGGRFGFAVKKECQIRNVYANGRSIAPKQESSVNAQELDYYEMELQGSGAQTIEIEF